MNETAVAIPENGAALAEQVVIKGDLSKLTEADRMNYYTAVCKSLGLNPLTRPFEYISLNGKLTLYATRAAGDQLRATRGITITNLDPRQIGDLYVVTATGRDRTGREDSSTGAVAITGLRGEALANAMMKAETKAKRRLTLSLAGLGWTDETEVESIPGAQHVEPPAQLSLAERAAAKRAEVQTVVDDSVGPPLPAAKNRVNTADIATYPVSGSLFTEDEAPPLLLSKPQFVARLRENEITADHAASVRLALFPDPSHELEDADRGVLWLQLAAEKEAQEAVPA